jgi:hypothetical protein
MPNYVQFAMLTDVAGDFQINIFYCEVLGNESET